MFQKAYFCVMKSMSRILTIVLLSSLSVFQAKAQLLVFHNSADTLLSTIKYTIAGGEPRLLDFRNNLFFNNPADVQGDIVFSNLQDSVVLVLEDVDLPAGTLKHLHLTGLSTQEGYLANPSGSETGLKAEIVTIESLPAPGANETRVIFVHGASDMPTVQLGAFPGPVFVNALAFGSSVAVTLPAINNNINILSSDSTLLLATYALQLEGRAGQTVVVMLSGFLAPLKNRSGAGFLPLLFAPGQNTGQPLPNVTLVERKEAVSNLSLYPNPSMGQFNIQMEASAGGLYQLQVINLSGQAVLEKVVPLSAGQNIIPMQLNDAAPGAYVLIFGQENRISAIPFVVSR
jgi:hypothetical protein